MQETSYRDYKTWMLYLNELLNTPSKEDYYLAQLTSEVANVLRTKNRLKIEDFLIEFELGEREEKKPLSREEENQRLSDLTAMAKSSMAARMGITPKQRKELEEKGRK